MIKKNNDDTEEKIAKRKDTVQQGDFIEHHPNQYSDPLCNIPREVILRSGKIRDQSSEARARKRKNPERVLRAVLNVVNVTSTVPEVTVSPLRFHLGEHGDVDAFGA
ncbi:MAG TPA: hypothetical protein VN604_04325 [Nitrospirota bacterium]|nr:hypothetical protein [Nitrospirota bacterium]